MTRVVKTSNLSRTSHLEPHKKVLHTEPFLSAWLSYSMELAGGGGEWQNILRSPQDLLLHMSTSASAVHWVK